MFPLVLLLVPVLDTAHCSLIFFFSLCVDVVQLEQDTVMGMKSLLLLCSQDDSASPQTTLKVSTLLCVHICTLC